MNFVDYLFNNKEIKNKTAIIDSFNNKYTYSEIYESIVKLSNYINNNIVDDKIIVFSDNSIFSIITTFSIIKSYHTCIPLNPDISNSELNYILNNSKCTHIFCEKKYMDRFSPNLNLYTESILDMLKFSEYTYQDKYIMKHNDSISASLILFTSGSTGLPKGVMLTNENLIYSVDSSVDMIKIVDTDILLYIIPYYHIYGFILLCLVLKSFGSIVISKSSLFSSSILNVIRENSCSVFPGVPSSYNILFENDKFSNRYLPTLTTFICTAGVLPENFTQNILDRFPKCEFYNIYGQTEAGGPIAISNSEILKKNSKTIGLSVKNINVNILSENGNICNPGEVGEIVVSGKNISKQYFNDNKESNKVFAKNMLYTKDLATMDSNGYIYYLGRKRNIIKSSGYRFNALEVENVLKQIPQVKDVSVIGVNDDILGEAVKAFIILSENNKSLTEKEILNFCTKKLPKYKIPKYIQFVNDIPTNNMGKVMYKSLESNLN